MLMPFFMPSAAAAPVTYAFGASAWNVTNLTTYTFSSMALSTAATSRQIVVCIGGSGAGAPRSVSACTVGGVSASLVVAEQHSGGTDYFTEIWVASVPTGTTGDVVVTCSSTMDFVGAGTFAIYDAAIGASSTGSTETDAGNVSMTVPANGVIVGGTFSNSNTGGVTWTANITEAYDEHISSIDGWHSGAAKLFASESTENFNVDWASPGSRLTTAFATWGPA